MKTLSSYFAILITSVAAATNVYLATLENPTDIQKQLSIACNTIAVAGIGALIESNDESSGES